MRWRPGILPFRGETLGVDCRGDLESHAGRAGAAESRPSPKLEEIINKALEKDRKLRYQNAADLQIDLRRLARDSAENRLGWIGSTKGKTRGEKAAATRETKTQSVRLRCGGRPCAGDCGRRISFPTSGLWRCARPRNEWEQLTFFTDSAVYPALSPDGRMLAFIRGDNSFFNREMSM